MTAEHAGSGPAISPVVGVGGVIVRAGGGGSREIVLVRRAHAPRAGSWSLPGGRLEHGEHLEAAVAREVLEETGLVVRVGSLVEVVEILSAPHHYVVLDYLCEATGGSLRAGDDASETVWANVDELGPYNLSDAVLGVVTKALALIRAT